MERICRAPERLARRSVLAQRPRGRCQTCREKYGSHRRRWDSPEPNEETPEAEWGFEPRLGEDVERFARDHGYRVARLNFEEPEDLSPLVADLYRWWYRQRRIRANRLFVESFIMVEPWWTLRTGSVPFWFKFNMEPSVEALERYLDSINRFDEIWLTLFQHGVEAVGLPRIEDWYEPLARARRRGELLASIRTCIRAASAVSGAIRMRSRRSARAIRCPGRSRSTSSRGSSRRTRAATRFSGKGPITTPVFTSRPERARRADRARAARPSAGRARSDRASGR